LSDLTPSLVIGKMCRFRRTEIYAVIETGGKQYKITPGQTIDVEYLGVAEGGTVELDRVLLIADGDRISVGTPMVAGAKVVATSQGDGKGKKIIVFKYWWLLRKGMVRARRLLSLNISQRCVTVRRQGTVSFIPDWLLTK